MDRGYLTQEELDIIANKVFVSKRLSQVRDIFVFSCYTGLSFVDIDNLREEHIQRSFDGNIWIKTKRQKTLVNSNVPLLDVPKAIRKNTKIGNQTGNYFLLSVIRK